ncbi:MAG: hypothetical protein WAV90_00370 [Gordonia amarae]
MTRIHIIENGTLPTEHVGNEEAVTTEPYRETIWPTYRPGGPVSELLKILTVRQGFRDKGLLPEAGVEETIAAVKDALQGPWFYGADGVFDKKRCAAALVEAWQLNPTPCMFMQAGDWLDFFELAEVEIRASGHGYSGTGHVNIFRGCPREHLSGISWTTDFHTAVWFAMRSRSRGIIGEVYCAVAPAEAVVADFREGICSHEQELVVDPARIGKIYRARLSIEDKELLLNEWLHGAERMLEDEAIRGGTPLGKPSIDIIPEPDGGWRPFPQAIYPGATGYVELATLPDNFRWPREDEVEFICKDGGVGAHIPLYVRD